MSKKIRALRVGIIFIVLMQVAASVVFANRQTHSMEIVKYATAVFDGGAFNLKAPFMSIMGLFSRIIKVHPLIITGTVMALIMIPIAYYSYYRLMKIIFKDDEVSALKAVAVICLINLFGYQSDKLMPAALLMGYFTGYSFAIHVILPLAVGKCIERMRRVQVEICENREEEESPTEENEFYQEEWDMKKHRIVNARNLAIALGVLAVMLVAFVYILNNKINSLYDATINLQNELNSSCRTYEYAPEGEVVAYVVKNSDGSIAVVGGGAEQYGDGLYDFIQKYSDHVTDWYVYGEDEENFGACDKCINYHELAVDNVYVVERTDLGR